MSRITFHITVTSPLVDTAAGIPGVLDAMTGLQKPQGELITTPLNAREKDVVSRLGVSSDACIYTFEINEIGLDQLCKQIASRILSVSNIDDKKILVEGQKAYSVINLQDLGKDKFINIIAATARLV